MNNLNLSILAVLQSKEDRDFVRANFFSKCKLFFEEEIENARCFLANQSFIDVVLVDSISQQSILSFINSNFIASYHCRVISILDNDETDKLDQALKLGAFDTIRRPLNPQTLEHRIKLAKAYVYDLDPVTNISSKESFFEKTREILSTNLNEDFSLARFDVDNFKLFNELYGMQEGNKLLLNIANCIKPYLKEKTIFCRYTSDHFVLFYKKGSIDIEKVIDSTLLALNSKQKKFKIVFSVGIYENCDRNISIEQMCERTLITLKTVKGKYNEFFAYYNDSYREQLLEEQMIIDEMSSALKNGEFVIYLQPQYNQATKTIVGAEALARWIHPTRGMISPAKFIPIFEHSGFIIELDKFIVHQACKLQRKWLDRNIIPPPIAVNMSIKDIEQDKFVDEITSIVKSYHLEPSCIHIEITESVFMNNPQKIIQRIKDLQKNGFEVEMDDFGSGFSSLNTLKDVPVNVLKLDMRFLEGDSNHERSGRILSSIIRMAHWLDLSVIAEGVETKEQTDLLLSMGCLYVQGYYFDRPMPIEDFEKKLTLSNSSLSQSLDTQEDHKVDLLALETDLYKFFSLLPIGSAIIEYNGSKVELIRFNEQFFSLLGTSTVQSHSKNFLLRNIIKTADWINFTNTIQKAIDTKGSSSCTVQTQCELFVKFNFNFLQQKNNASYLYASIEDFNQPMQTQLDLIAAQKELKTIKDTLDSGMVKLEFEQTLKLIDCDNKFASLFDFTKAELLEIYKSNPLMGIHPEDISKILETIRYHQKNKYPFVKIEFRQICKDGSYKDVSYSLSFSYYLNVIKIFAIVTDITKYEQTKRELQNQKNQNTVTNSRLDSVKNLIPFYSLSLKYEKGDFKIISCNRTFASLLGYKTILELIELGLQELINKHVLPADIKNLRAIQKKLMNQDSIHTNKFATSFKLITSNKQEIDVHARIEQIHESNDSSYIEVVFIDTSTIIGDTNVANLIHFSKLLDEMGIACYYVNRKTQQTTISSSIYQYALSNYSWLNVDYLSKELKDTIHPDDIDTFSKLLDKNRDSDIHKLHVRLKTIANVFVPTKIIYSFGFDENKQVNSLLLSIIQDIKPTNEQEAIVYNEKQVITQPYFGFGIFELKQDDGLYQQYADEKLAEILGYSTQESDLRSKLKSNAILSFEPSFYTKENIDKLLSKPEHNEMFKLKMANGLLKWANVIIHVTQTAKRILLHIAVQQCPEQMANLIEQSKKLEDHAILLSTLSIGMLKYYNETKELVAINSILLNLLGYTQGELYDLCNKNFDKLVYYEDANQSSNIRELRIRNKAGQLLWFRFVSSAVGDYTIASLTPIQEEKQLLQTAITNNKINVALQRLCKSGFLKIKIFGNRWSFESASPELLKIVNYSNEELKILLKNDILALVHNDYREEVREFNRSKYEEGTKEFNTSFKVKCKDSSYRWFAANNIFITELGVEYCYSLWMDITEQKEHELQDRKKEDYYQHILDALPGGVALFEVHPNVQHELIYASEGFPKVFNVTDLNEFFNLTNNYGKRYTHKDDIPVLEAAIDKMLQTSEPFELDFRVIRDDQSMIWVKSKTCLIDNHNGNPVYLCILLPKSGK